MSPPRGGSRGGPSKRGKAEGQGKHGKAGGARKSTKTSGARAAKSSAPARTVWCTSAWQRHARQARHRDGRIVEHTRRVAAAGAHRNRSRRHRADDARGRAARLLRLGGRARSAQGRRARLGQGRGRTARGAATRPARACPPSPSIQPRPATSTTPSPLSALPDGAVRVWVHIADVAAHVPLGSAIDLEARRRSTSVYVPGTVEPMLPHALSSDACSLVPGAERLAVTVEMRVARRRGRLRELLPLADPLGHAPRLRAGRSHLRAGRAGA